MTQEKNNFIQGEEHFRGKKMTKKEYLDLEHLDVKKEVKENVKKSYRLLNEDVIVFLNSMGENKRTLLPIINFNGNTEVGPETIEII